MSKYSTEELIVDQIIANLSDRSGFDAWWEQIEPDIRDEIKESLIKNVQERLT